VILLATLVFLSQAFTTDSVESGWASQYNEGVMERVIENRQNGC
jgi:hypothetical protein